MYLVIDCLLLFVRPIFPLCFVLFCFVSILFFSFFFCTKHEILSYQCDQIYVNFFSRKCWKSESTKNKWWKKMRNRKCLRTQSFCESNRKFPKLIHIFNWSHSSNVMCRWNKPNWCSRHIRSIESRMGLFSILLIFGSKAQTCFPLSTKTFEATQQIDWAQFGIKFNTQPDKNPHSIF